MTLVIVQCDIKIEERVDVLDVLIQGHPRSRKDRPLHLYQSLLRMVHIQMQVTVRDDQFTWLQVAALGHHHSEQRIRCNVEWNAQEDVR